MKTARLIALSLVAACYGAMPKEQPLPSDFEEGPESADELRAEDHTPGYFRDMYRILAAQMQLDDATAVYRLRLELESRTAEVGDLPEMLPVDVATLEGLHILALRSVQATSAAPAVARQLGEEMLRVSLGLDPAIEAWNRTHDPDALETDGGAKTLATVGRWALARAAEDYPVLCQQALGLSDWSSGDAEVVWIDEVCEPDQWVGGYCEDDEWLEGDCWDEWVPENCSGGRWVDRGYYEYYCYSSDDCRYVWRSRWIYEEGYCSDGYWEEYCDNGYWEEGICYDGTFVPGYCQPGHYEYRFPGGTWTFENYAVDPQCTEVRPTQYAIAVAAARVLYAKAVDGLTPEWRAALEALVADPRLETPDEGVLSAIRQVLEAAASATE
jgi:hypothetical protein